MESSKTEKTSLDLDLQQEISDIEEKTQDNFDIFSSSSENVEAEELQKHLLELIQRKQKLKWQNLMLDYIKDPEQFKKTLQQSYGYDGDSTHINIQDLDDIISEIQSVQANKDAEMANTVSSAEALLSELKESLRVSGEKVQILQNLQEEEKCSDSSEQEAEGKNFGLSLENSKLEKELLCGRIKRMQSVLDCLQPVSQSHSQIAIDGQSQVERLSKLKKELELFSRIECVLKGSGKLDLIISPKPFDTGKSFHKDIPLVASLTFLQTPDDDSYVLSDVVLSETVNNSEEIIKSALSSSDLPRLVVDLQSAWDTCGYLVSEIHCLRDSHALDWIPETHILHLMVEQGESVICTLEVPRLYPTSGTISLVNVVGDSSGKPLDQVQAPLGSSLTQWILHLENVFKLP